MAAPETTETQAGISYSKKQSFERDSSLHVFFLSTKRFYREAESFCIDSPQVGTLQLLMKVVENGGALKVTII